MIGCLVMKVFLLASIYVYYSVLIMVHTCSLEYPCSLFAKTGVNHTGGLEVSKSTFL